MPDPGLVSPSFSAAEMHPPVAVPLRLVARHVLAPEIVEIRLRPPGESGLAWQAGQYLDLLPPDGRRRSYSIANPPPGVDIARFSPGPGGEIVAGDLVLHVRLGAEGSYSRVLAALPEGSLLDAEVARGEFRVPPGGPGQALWLAGGTGLAPLMAMLATVLPGIRALQHLFWGVREEADLYAAVTLDAWSARYPAFTWTPVLSVPAATWAGARGLVHEALLSMHGRLDRHGVFASGPPAMISAAQTMFLAAGLPAERLHYDRFETAQKVVA